MSYILPFAEPSGFRFRGEGAAFTIVAGTTQDCDFKITDENKVMNGLQIFLKDHAFDDTATLQVVDVDGTYYPAGTVLEPKFATNWLFDSTKEGQFPTVLSYKADLPLGLYVRVKYTSTGATNVKMKVNYFLHKAP